MQIIYFLSIRRLDKKIFNLNWSHLMTNTRIMGDVDGRVGEWVAGEVIIEAKQQQPWPLWANSAVVSSTQQSLAQRGHGCCCCSASVMTSPAIHSPTRPSTSPIMHVLVNISSSNNKKQQTRPCLATASKSIDAVTRPTTPLSIRRLSNDPFCVHSQAVQRSLCVNSQAVQRSLLYQCTDCKSRHRRVLWQGEQLLRAGEGWCR